MINIEKMRESSCAASKEKVLNMILNARCVFSRDRILISLADS